MTQMTALILAHCLSCRQNMVPEVIIPKFGRPIKRCRFCRSLNFRVLSTAEKEEESPQDYARILDKVFKETEISNDREE